MKISNQSISTLMIRLIAICTLSMISLSFFLDIQILSYLLFANIALSFMLFLFSFRGNNLQYTAILLAILTMMRYLLFFGTIKFVDALIFISIIFYAASVISVGVDKTTKNIMLLGALFTAVMMFMNITAADSFSYQGRLQYNFVNSNTAANVALNLLAILMICRISVKETYKKFLLLLFEVGLLQVLWLTYSRAGFIAGMAAEVCVILLHFGKIRGKKIHWWTYTPIIAVPIMFILFERLIGTEIEFMGKPLFSGRETLWSDALKVIWNNLIAFENEFTSGLNMALRLPYICGIFGAVVYFAFLVSGVKKLQRQANEQNAKTCLLALVLFEALIFQQCFESTIVSGTFSTAFITMTVLGMAKPSDDQKLKSGQSEVAQSMVERSLK